MVKDCRMFPCGVHTFTKLATIVGICNPMHRNIKTFSISVPFRAPISQNQGPFQSFFSGFFTTPAVRRPSMPMMMGDGNSTTLTCSLS